MTTTMEVSETLERVDNIVNMLDEICDHMDGFSSAEEAWLSSITETLRTWRYVMQEPTEARKTTKRTNSVVSIVESLGRCLRNRVHVASVAELRSGSQRFRNACAVRTA